MSFIPKNPLSLPEIEHTPSTPSGTRGLFAGKDGWYEVDTKGTKRKLVFGDDVRNEIQAMKSLQYYGDANIVPSDARLFKFAPKDDGTVSVGADSTDISGDIVIPFEYVNGDKVYTVSEIITEGFGECKKINSIVIPNTFSQIADYAFTMCGKLVNIAIPESVTHIGEAAFYGCSFETLELPKITSLENNLFNSCYDLKKITIPNTVKVIKNEVFDFCSVLNNIYYEGTKDEWDNILKGISYDDFNPLERATIHYGWTDVSKEYVKEQIDKAVIEGGSTVVDDLLDLNSENPVQNKVITAKFNEVDAKTKALQYYGDANIVPSDADLFEFEWVGEHTDYGFVLLGFSVGAKSADISGDIVIPCEAVEKSGTVVKLMGIKQSAFADCINITSVIIPDGNDILIGRYAFKGCAGITNVTISKSVTEIGESTFSGCISLTDVYFRGTKAQWDAIEIGEGNDNLLNATIHYEYTDVTKDYVKEQIDEVDTKTKSLQYYGDANIIPSGNNLFEFTVDDTTMTAKVNSIPDFYPSEDVIAIPYQYVKNNKTYIVTEIDLCLYNADKWVFPNTLKKMRMMDFYSGGSFVVPDGIEELSDHAFISVFDLTNISLPQSLKRIGIDAFESNLTDIYFRGSKAQWDAIRIDESNDNLFNATIHYEELVNIDSELSETSENAVQNKVVTTRINELDEHLSYEIQGLNIQTYKFETDIGNINTALEELTLSIEDNGDTESLDIYIENNKRYYNGVVSTSIIGTIPEDIPLNFTSALYFVTPDTMPENYSQFPENIHFDGDSTDEGTFVPEPNMRYTIVFDFDGYMLNGYVKGVTTV